MSLSIWAWYRSRRAQEIATTEANAMAANTGNMHGLGTNNATSSPQTKDNKSKAPDSLFGPNIGVISNGPSWTASTEKKMLKDELTMDVIKGWIEKSKESTQPTTTLQALVNLKRPTLRLSPLSADAEHPEESHSQHALEFEFDADAPKCGIYVHVLLPPDHPESLSATNDDSTPTSSSKPRYSKVLVFESVVEGGFGTVLKLDDGAVLELGRFETLRETASTAPGNQKGSGTNPDPQTTAVTNNSTGATASRNNGRRRITQLFRKRRNNVAVSGPALAVVDASSQPADSPNADTTPSNDKKKDEQDEGVKVTIRLVALDEQGTELESPNEQTTFLSVERFGTRTTKPKAVEPTTSGAEAAPESSTSDENKDGENTEDISTDEDTRPWVVKVVKREATIGPHTFQLHEIYGLTSSHSSGTHAPPPTTPLPTTHTYPPQPDPAAQADAGDDSLSECLLCLSSPREVVLLPCRHLVACKDCALNMVEFGAGGAITQATADDGTTPATVAAETTGGAEGATPAATTADATATPANPRRKRKAKGWFCPVCRQPYSSLLRITTNPPPIPTSAKDERASTSQDEERDITDAAEPGAGAELPLPVTTPGASNNGTSGGGSGILSRPGELFRSLTSRGAQPVRRDIESQA